jgi:glycosyltransferase involved in cell wall biosynthesis
MDFAKQLGVDVEFKGVVTDEVKFRTIQESKLCIEPWAWLPVGEAAYYGKPSIAYDEPETRYRLGQIPVYTKSNAVEQLSETIITLLEDNGQREQFGRQAKEMILSGYSYTKPIPMAVDTMLKLFEVTKE